MLTKFARRKKPKPTKKNARDRVLLEKDIEIYGSKKAKYFGWVFEKFRSVNNPSIPDRIITANCESAWFPTGMVFFIEFKRPGKTATDKQRLDHEKRRKKGCLVFVVSSYEEMDVVTEIVNFISKTGEIPELPEWLLV